MNYKNIEQAIYLFNMCNTADLTESPYGVSKLYQALHSASVSLSRYDVCMCNGDYHYDDKTDNYPVYEQQVQHAYKRINNAIDKYLNIPNLYWYHQGDPRGCSLHVSTSKIDSINYSQSGLAIF